MGAYVERKNHSSLAHSDSSIWCGMCLSGSNHSLLGEMCLPSSGENSCHCADSIYCRDREELGGGSDGKVTHLGKNSEVSCVTKDCCNEARNNAGCYSARETHSEYDCPYDSLCAKSANTQSTIQGHLNS